MVIGLRSLGFGLRSWVLGLLWSSVVGLVGLCSLVFAIYSLVSGLKSSGFGLKSKVFDLWSSVFGFRSFVFGL